MPLLTTDGYRKYLTGTYNLYFDGLGTFLPGNERVIYTLKNEAGEWEKLSVFDIDRVAVHGEKIYLMTEDKILEYDLEELMDSLQQEMVDEKSYR